MHQINPIGLIEKFYPRHSLCYSILVRHSKAVAAKALEVAKRLKNLDCSFIDQAAMLHDIGIFYTHAPELGCYGEKPYIMHGICGAQLLRKEGLEHHALVCQNHIGVGLTIEDIKTQNLPLPHRTMEPTDTETRIIAYADLFYSKNPAKLDQEKSPEQIRSSLEKFSPHKVEIFNQWHREFTL